MTERLLRRTCMLVMLTLLGGRGPAHGQASAVASPAAGPYARLVVLAPHPGAATAFEAGYERHLAWHRAQRDPWAWYGWSFVLGERLGLFMDGTFGHAAADFDAAVQPAADAADNARNVTPHAAFLSHGVYERLAALSRGPSLPDTSAFLVLGTYRVVPGREAAFEAALAALPDTGSRGAAPLRYTWMRLTLGGSAPQYLLLRAVPTWAAAVSLPDPVAPAPGLVESVRTELLRYRPTLSYQP